MRLRALLLTEGVPWTTAFEDLSHEDALGLYVCIGEAKGGTFLWDEMRWKKEGR